MLGGIHREIIIQRGPEFGIRNLATNRFFVASEFSGSMIALTRGNCARFTSVRVLKFTTTRFFDASNFPGSSAASTRHPRRLPYVLVSSTFWNETSWKCTCLDALASMHFASTCCSVALSLVHSILRVKRFVESMKTIFWKDRFL